MAQPLLKFGSINLSDATIYSYVANRDSFIQVRANFTQGSNQATITEDRDGYFGSSSIEVGYDLRSVGEVSTAVPITAYNPATKVITFDGTAEADGSNQITRINLPKGKIFIESASFQKVGGSTVNLPNNLRDVTGSLDPEYNNTNLTWGLIGQLASTSSIETPLAGMYAQYELVEFERRNNLSSANLILTASDSIPAFVEPIGYTLTRQDGISYLLLSEISSSLMSIAGASDILGDQALGLAAYQTAIASTLATFGEGSGFPFTGSAQITGSLGVTGSAEFIQDDNRVGDFFIVKSGSLKSLSTNDSGVVKFGDFQYTPPATAGGIMYSGSNFFAGIE